MLFPSVLYFVRLSIAILLFWLFGKRLLARLLMLTIASALVVAYLLHKHLQNETAICFAIVLAALVIASYRFGVRLIHKRSQALLLPAIALPFSVFIAAYLTSSFGVLGKPTPWIVPISLGFFALRQSHFVYECYRGGIKQADFLSYIAYVTFFPTLIAGPLERFPKFVDQVRQARFGWDHFGVAAERLIGGALKKFVIADGFIAAALPPTSLTDNSFVDVTWWTLVFACTAKLLYVYLDFSGYTDMARGTARLFGIELIRNFNFPLLRSNLAEFWRSWHMSLSSFLRDYIYFPFVAKYRNTVVPLFATMVASGAWHGINPGWLLWGVHHGVGLVCLARFQRNVHKFPWLANFRNTGKWRVAATLLTWFWVVAGFALTWHVDNITLSLQIYFRFLTFGLMQ